MDKLKLIFVALLITGTLSAQSFEPVPYDKKYHIGAGAVAGIWGMFAGNSCEFTAEQSALCGIAAAMAAGLGKELMDVSEAWIFKQPHNFDAMDLAVTVLGGIVGTGLTYAGLKIFYHYKPQIFIGNVQNNLTIGLRFNI